VMQHRLRPLLEERDAQGRLVRDRVRELVLVTNYWDTCRGGHEANLAARAWNFREFASDVARHGITPVNRNYLQNRWRRLSSLVLFQDRGYGYVRVALKNMLMSPAALETARERARQRRVDVRLVETEEHFSTCFDPEQLAALDRLVEYADARSLRTTIVLFPLAHAVVTDRARETTLARYDGLVRDLAARRRVRVVDMTLDHPLADRDFESDMDHLTAPANEKFADWALAGPLAPLRAASSAAATSASLPGRTR